MKLFFDSILYSYGQIFFSNRKWFGFAALLATLVSIETGLLSLLGVMMSNLIALWLKFDKEKIRSGFYGFNGLLLGASASFFYQLSPFLIFIIIIFIFITFFIAASLENLLATILNLPGLSLPFVAALYIFIIFVSNFESVFFKGMEFHQIYIFTQLPEVIQIYLKSFSLILFQQNLLSGVILVVALTFFSRVMFVNSILAFTLNYFFLNIIFTNPTETMLVLTSFNSILVSFALGGSLIIVSRKTIPLLVVSVLMVIIFTGFFSKLSTDNFLPVLVLPFNFIVLSTIYSLKFRKEQTDLALIYFKPGSPEENFYYHHNRKSRFDKFKNLAAELPFNGEWFVSQGIDGEHTHKEDYKYAWDFIIADERQEYSKNEGKLLEDHYCYNVPITASLDAQVERVIDNIEDNEIGETNVKQNWGNTVILNHGDGLYSAVSHLKPGSIVVEKDDKVSAGDVLGACGSSGRSPSPHLHFQFQLTNKLGDKTYNFPLSYYYEKKNSEFELKVFEHPLEGAFVKKLEIHKSFKNALEFQLGDKLQFDCELNGKQFSEEWEVKVDIMNNMYIQSDEETFSFLYPQEKMFFQTNFVGIKKTALYYFYLTAASLPLGFEEKLVWEEEIPISVTMNSFARYLSEFFLIAGQSIKSKIKYSLHEDNETGQFVVRSIIKTEGAGMFKFYRKLSEGKIWIDKDGYISKFEFKDEKNSFVAKINTDEEKF